MSTNFNEEVIMKELIDFKKICDKTLNDYLNYFTY